MTEQEKFYKALREILTGVFIGFGIGMFVIIVAFVVFVFF